jgi:hypothetical protein
MTQYHLISVLKFRWGKNKINSSFAALGIHTVWILNASQLYFMTHTAIVPHSDPIISLHDLPKIPS